MWQLLRSMRADSKGANECLLDTSSSREKTAPVENSPLRQILIGGSLKGRYMGRRERPIVRFVGLLICSVWLASQILLQSKRWSIDTANGGWVWHKDPISKKN